MSSFVLSKDEVIEICKGVEPWVRKYRLEKLEEAILETMQTGTVREKWFKKRPLTREEAIAFLKSKNHPYAWSTPYQDIMTQYNGALDKASKLLDACSVTTSKNVVLSTDLAAFVGSWKEEK